MGESLPYHDFLAKFLQTMRLSNAFDRLLEHILTSVITDRSSDERIRRHFAATLRFSKDPTSVDS